ncbi:hypothetical protein BaRGS_00040174, partial [Batillaria attramentaria]
QQTYNTSRAQNRLMSRSEERERRMGELRKGRGGVVCESRPFKRAPGDHLITVDMNTSGSLVSRAFTQVLPHGNFTLPLYSPLCGRHDYAIWDSPGAGDTLTALRS